MDSKARTVKDFGRGKIKEIATEYAENGITTTAITLADKYDVSVDTIYKIIAKAIVEHIVREETARCIAQKAALSAYNKLIGRYGRTAAEQASERSIKHYNDLFAKRAEYKPEDDKIKTLVELYAKSHDYILYFCNDHFITVELMKKMIKNAVINNLVSAETVLSLMQKSFGQSSNGDSAQHWGSLLRERENNKKQG